MKIRQCILIEPFTCRETDSIVTVAKKLREISLRHIFVVDETGYPQGIISMTDINNRVVAEGKDATNLKAKDIMTAPIDVADIDDDIEQWHATMTEKNHVMEAVVEKGKMKGIVTIHQIIKNREKHE
ncbi:MAG: Inosine-5-monophosphate dehydrogenase [archaeon]|jgi:signal-transduction protein with cAMP-binding, CBS, and nucleotidyltransferase domain